MICEKKYFRQGGVVKMSFFALAGLGEPR